MSDQSKGRWDDVFSQGQFALMRGELGLVLGGGDIIIERQDDVLLPRSRSPFNLGTWDVRQKEWQIGQSQAPF